MVIFVVLTQAGVCGGLTGFPRFMWPKDNSGDWRIDLVLAGRTRKFAGTAWPLGVLVGIIGIVQWIGMGKLEQMYVPYLPPLRRGRFNPFTAI